MKHTNDIIPCPSCEYKLADCHPDLADWFRMRVKKNLPLMHISWGWRGEEDQERCVLEKKSKLHFPMSPHNKMDELGNKCSRAIDLFELIGQKGMWPMSEFHKIQVLIDENNDPIKWGGRWGWDSDHFQLEDA